jgi:hypothetical protein
MAEPKTKVNDASVDDFIAGIEPARRADCKAIVTLMQKATKSPPKMWGTAIVGFGIYSYTYESGRKGDWPLVAFSPRKQNLTLYIMSGFAEYDALMSKLGKHKTGKACLYINSLADVDLKVLEKLVKASVKYMKEKYPA